MCCPYLFVLLDWCLLLIICSSAGTMSILYNQKGGLDESAMHATNKPLRRVVVSVSLTFGERHLLSE